MTAMVAGSVAVKVSRMRCSEVARVKFAASVHVDTICMFFYKLQYFKICN